LIRSNRLHHILPKQLQIKIHKSTGLFQLAGRQEGAASHGVVVCGVAVAAEPPEPLNLLKLAIADGEF